MDPRLLLEQVRSGSLSVEDALENLKVLPYEELGFAKPDHHRSLRAGFGEAVYCAGKTPEHTAKIFLSLSQDGNVLGTRAEKAHYLAVRELLPYTEYDPVSGILTSVTNPPAPKGLICVCTGGTSDIPVAEEAARAAEFFGSRVIRIHDVGVAGIHRLLDKLSEIREANCVIAIAGMEGALPGVLAGMVDKPVIAVPTSVGYGANFGGLSALLTMLNTCSEGIGVVNIDNGFGAGYLAAQINHLAARGGETV